MKNTFILFVFIVSSSFLVSDSSVKDFPQVEIINLDGTPLNTKDFVKDGKPAYVAFWATWCANCFKELKAINNQYETWQKETGVKVYAISIDDIRTQPRVKKVVDKKMWKFNVGLDPEKKLSTALNVKTPPHSFIIDKTGKIVWSHVGYKPGDEKKAFEFLKSLK